MLRVSYIYNIIYNIYIIIIIIIIIIRSQFWKWILGICCDWLGCIIQEKNSNQRKESCSIEFSWQSSPVECWDRDLSKNQLTNKNVAKNAMGSPIFWDTSICWKEFKNKMPFEVIRTSKRPSTWTSLLLLGRCLTLQCQRHTKCTKRDGSKEVLYKACFSHISQGLYLLQSLGRTSQTKPVSWLDFQILFRCTSPFFIHLWCIYLQFTIKINEFM